MPTTKATCLIVKRVRLHTYVLNTFLILQNLWYIYIIISVNMSLWNSIRTKGKGRLQEKSRFVQEKSFCSLQKKRKQKRLVFCFLSHTINV